MQESELRAYLALHRTPHLSDRALSRLIVSCAKPDDIFHLGSTELNALQIPADAQQALKQGADLKQLAHDCALVTKLGIAVVPISAAQYPELLKQISDPPPLLYVRGDIALLNKPQLAMVGSRRTSAQGRENAYRFAREFASNGFTVTSGLALGIDAECHRGALAGNGHTVAVLGTGIDKIYPARNRSLFDEIAHRGAIISEFPLGTGPLRHLFPKRNRVISGMSLGVLVVEAALKSGSLITARCALEQGREVFAIPGSIHSTGCHGCHTLIKQGAKLVETASDILEEFGGWLTPRPLLSPGAETPAEVTVTVNAEEQQLMDLMGYDPAPIDLLQQRSGWTLAALASILMTLELKGLIENTAGCYQRICRQSVPSCPRDEA